MILTENLFSWNRKAHLLFLESPSGVGFSRNPNKIIFNDDQVAKDNLAVLQEFFSNYPTFQNNPLWVSYNILIRLLVKVMQEHTFLC